MLPRATAGAVTGATTCTAYKIIALGVLATVTAARVIEIVFTGVRIVNSIDECTKMSSLQNINVLLQQLFAPVKSLKVCCVYVSIASVPCVQAMLVMLR